MSTLRNSLELKERRRSLRRKMTAAERLLWRELRTRRLNGIRFARQYSVGPYILDFCAPAISLALEIDGPDHADEHSIRYDRKRTDYLASQGIEVLRFWNEEVFDRLSFVLERIAEVAAERAAARQPG